MEYKKSELDSSTGVVNLRSSFIRSTLTKEDLVRIASGPISSRNINPNLMVTSLVGNLTDQIYQLLDPNCRILYTEGSPKMYIVSQSKDDPDKSGFMTYSLLVSETDGADPRLIAVITFWGGNYHLSDIRVGRGVNKRNLDQYLRLAVGSSWGIFSNGK